VSPTQRANAVKRLATELGFDRVGMASAAPSPRADFVRQWLSRGYAGRMHYLQRNADRRTDPRSWLPDCKSAIVVAVNYHQCAPEQPATETPHGRVARYAWGQDYHVVVRDRLKMLVDRLREEISEPFEAKVCVDTAAVVERELAAAAGVGWIGKNTLVLHPRAGSYFYLGEVLTTLELQPDSPMPDRCGTCTRCLEVCPTSAFPQPYVMDASRCISYLTIELRESIPAELREPMGDWLFGCDVCQEVCPYNRRAPLEVWPKLAADPQRTWFDLQEVLNWSAEEYASILHGSAMKRAKVGMLRRNAAVALGNRGDESHLPLLDQFAEDDDSMLALHAAWAAGAIRRRSSRGGG
jgi:epoxyqueuosine reductase